MNVVLIGFRGSGKSTVGRQLAERLGWRFVDTDASIEQRMGATIREIFTDRAEQGFRDLEEEIVAEVSRQDCQVISTGGGVVLREANAKALRTTGKLIYLTAPAEVLWLRIFYDAHRHRTRLPIDPAAGQEQVKLALAEREPKYRQLADMTVDTTGQPIPQIVEQIIKGLGLPPVA